MQINDEPDLYLKNLAHFTGSTHYYAVLGRNVTDGVKYLMDNGYAWFITDALAVIIFKGRLRKQPFLTVELVLQDENEAKMVITDGNEKTLYTQKYKFTDAKRGFKLYCEHGVLLLAGEH